MALVLLYILPVLLAFVLIPKQSEATHQLKTESVRSDIASELAEVINVGLGQKSRSSYAKTRHGHRQRSGFNSKNTETENSKTSQELATGAQEIVDDVQETTFNDENQFMDDNEDVISAFDDTAIDSKEDLSTDLVTERNNQDTATGNGDDEVNANDDAIDNKDTELDTDETVTQHVNGELKYSTESSTQKPSTSCARCNRNAISEKELKIEMVKQHLLQKLGLTTVPEVDGPLPPLPFDFYLGEDFSISDDAKGEKEETKNNVNTREMFIFGKDITDICAKKKGTGCYSFNTTSSYIDPALVSSIELWIYKQPDVNDHHIQEFMVSELEPYVKNGKEVLRFRNIVKRIETRLKYGWMKIYVKRSVIRWLSKPHRNHGLAVVCKTCQRQNHKTIYGNKEGYMPILVFYMKRHAQSHRRSKRHTQCIEGGSNCCHKEELVINFHDIGWDYIMTPETIRPNFCTGSCNGVQAAYHNHTRLMQTLRQSVLHDYSSIHPCCSPVSFARPQSLLYRDHAGVVRKVDVPDLIIGECGCT